METRIIEMIIGITVPLVSAIGVILKLYLDARTKIKELSVKEHINDENHEIEKLTTDINAAKELSIILKDVIEPLSKRIRILEDEAISRRQQIQELYTEVIELQRVIGLKDVEIDRLKAENLKQTKISLDQACTIQEQERRITELENKLCKENKDGNV